MVSGRRTYIDPLLSLIRDEDTDVPTYYFYDLNAKLNQDFSENDKVQISGYFGRDDLSFDIDEGDFFGIRWGNTAFLGKWDACVFRLRYLAILWWRAAITPVRQN